MLDSEINRKEVLSYFPDLIDDLNWKVTSDKDLIYNCIAWACHRDDIIFWPELEKLDGVDWPFYLPKNLEIETFIQLFRNYQYEICDSYVFEEGFQKIAIFFDEIKGQCTHACRQTNQGLWTSKLGTRFFDIIHSSPYETQIPHYGNVKVLMKRKNTAFTMKTNKPMQKKLNRKARVLQLKSVKS